MLSDIKIQIQPANAQDNSLTGGGDQNNGGKETIELGLPRRSCKFLRVVSKFYGL